MMQHEVAEADRFAVAGAVEQQHRDATLDHFRNAAEVLDFFGDIKAVEEQHDRAFFARLLFGVHDDARQTGAFVGNFNVFEAQRLVEFRTLAEGVDAALVSSLGFCGLRLREAFADVIVMRGTQQISGGGDVAAFGRLGVADVLDAFGFTRPFVEPGDVVADVVLQTQSDAVDFINLGAAPGRAA